MPEHPTPDDALQSLLIRTMVLVCVRNSKLEDIHAGLTPVTRTGEHSDVTVIDADGRRIPWPEVPHRREECVRQAPTIELPLSSFVPTASTQWEC